MEKEGTMYLVNKNGILIGRCVHYPFRNGWLFLPSSTVHKPGRVMRPTANQAIPKWAFDLSDDFLTADEFIKLTTAAA